MWSVACSARTRRYAAHVAARSRPRNQDRTISDGWNCEKAVSTHEDWFPRRKSRGGYRVVGGVLAAVVPHDAPANPVTEEAVDQVVREVGADRSRCDPPPARTQTLPEGNVREGPPPEGHERSAHRDALHEHHEDAVDDFCPRGRGERDAGVVPLAQEGERGEHHGHAEEDQEHVGEGHAEPRQAQHEADRRAEVHERAVDGVAVLFRRDGRRRETDVGGGHHGSNA